MKRNPLTLLTGLVIALIFGALLFLFQVRETEVAVITTFGKYTGTRTEPGLYLRWPWPIQNVHRFDNRIRNFERKYEETYTRDGRILLMEAFLGWQISSPELFLERFGGDVTSAEQRLEGLLRSTKNGVIGQHPLSDLISTNPQELKFEKIEQEMRDIIQPAAAKEYGIRVVLLGIKQIGLPESITTKVFERMKAEREQLVKQFKGEGDAEAISIRAEAESRRAQILAEAERQATIIKGQADAQASQSLKVFEQNPPLAIFLLKLKALDDALKDRATLVLDPRTPPFDLLKGASELPTGKP